MTQAQFDQDLHDLIARAHTAKLDLREMADTLQGELDEIEIHLGDITKSALRGQANGLSAG